MFDETSASLGQHEQGEITLRTPSFLTKLHLVENFFLLFAFSAMCLYWPLIVDEFVPSCSTTLTYWSISNKRRKRAGKTTKNAWLSGQNYTNQKMMNNMDSR